MSNLQIKYKFLGEENDNNNNNNEFNKIKYFINFIMISLINIEK